MNATSVVLGKELRDHLRDRRSMMSALLLPLIGPLMFGGMFSLIAKWGNENKPLVVAVAGADNAPNLIAFLQRHGATVVTAPADFEAKVRDDELEVALSVPREYGKKFEGGQAAKVALIADSSNNKARVTVRRVQLLLQSYGSQLGALRLLARGISPLLATPLQLEEVDVATPERTAANLLGMIPLFLLMTVFAGGMYLAIDGMAGERERGSLEPLLLNPAPRRAIAIGKWLAVVLVTWLALLVAGAGFAIAVTHVPLQDLGVKLQLSVPSGLLLLLVLLPLTFFAAALQMLTSLFSRTYKEAQTWLSLMMLIPVIPAAMLAIAPIKSAAWMMLVPALSQTVLMTDVLRGDPVRPGWVLLSVASVALCAGLCLAGIVRMLREERIVFGRSGA